MSADVREFADQLRQYATHFVPRDWAYTRDLGDLREIRYARPEDSLWGRIREAVRWLLRTPQKWEQQLGFTGGAWRLRMALHVLRRDRHLPDGVLDGGSVIAIWEETGEYLQYVQPSVGALLADLMDAHPHLPEVQAIADEMKRINDDYGRRIAETSDSS